MPHESDSTSLNGLMREAVERGIIDVAQRDRLAALATELAGQRGTGAITAEGSATSARREARRGVNAITIAYALGALLVVFALAWFLFERWKALGPGGVLGVGVVYAVVFTVVGETLRRRGFEVAGGIALVLAIAMTPVWTWAILRLTGEMPDPDAWDNALSRYDPYVASRVMVMELATIGVALAFVRRVRFSLLAAPIAAATVALMMSAGQALADPRLTWYLAGYYQAVVACVLLAIAYAIDRRQPPDEDYAFWFYLAGAIMVFVAYSQMWPYIGRWRHGITLVAVAFATASLYLRRRTLLVAGALMAFAYLGYLAFDVFRRVVALPITLATLGLLVIVFTVWMQRRFPALVDRVSAADEAGATRLPTGSIAVLGPLAISIAAMLFAVGDAREQTVEREWRERYYRLHARHRAITERARKATESGPPSARPEPLRREP